MKKQTANHVLVQTLLVLLCSFSLKAQTLTPGFSVKLRFEFGNKMYANYQVSSALGVDYQLPTKTKFMSLTYHLSTNLYRGGLGSSLLLNDANKLRLELVNSIGATLGLTGKELKSTGKEYDPTYWKRPLYYWSNHVATPLLNPYEYSFTLATNFIWCNLKQDKNSPARQSQQLWFTGINAHNFTIGMFNDGPPFDLFGLGDGFDRYWTGGGFFNFRLKKYLNGQFETSFDRFTGYSRDAYEAAGKLGFRFVPYGVNAKWNQGRMMFTFKHDSGIALNWTQYNLSPNWDVQFLIHKAGKLPFHPNVYKKHLNMVGVNYDSYQNIHFPNK